MKDYLKELINGSPDHMISYAKFMEEALYHPTYGYYNRGRRKVGKEGDFITSVSVHSIFAKVMADAFYHYVIKEDLPFNICELGGADASFASIVLDHFQKNYPDSYHDLHYFFVEQSGYHREAAITKLDTHKEKVTFYASIDDLISDHNTFDGIVFSNELFDALPVHVVEKQHETINEVMLTHNEGQLIEKQIPLSNQTLKSWIDKYDLQFSHGQRQEISLEMTRLIKKLSAWMNDTVFITIDYGYTNEELQFPERREGSLRGYYKHQLIANPLEHPGEMDLTTHIPIDVFRKACQMEGLKELDVTLQGDFLHKSGILNYLQNHSANNPFSEEAKTNRAIRSFLLGSFSRSFYVLVFAK